MSDSVLVVWTTLPDMAKANELAAKLVDEGWVACAQVDSRPIESTYPWKGSIQNDAEIRLTLKAPVDSWEGLCRRIGQLHPYELPQIVGVEARATGEYAAWVKANTKAP